MKYLFVQVDSCRHPIQPADRPQRKIFKAAIVDNCHARGDQWSNEVLVRVEGAVSDLHAADGRYHYDCKTNFMAPR